jgi:putative tricarboxylic transport membrane protein
MQRAVLGRSGLLDIPGPDDPGHPRFARAALRREEIIGTMNKAAIKRPDTAGLLIAAALLAMAAVIWWDATSLKLSSVYGVGPQAMPMVVAAGLGVLAAGNFVMAWKGDLPPREEADPAATLLILGGLAALIVLIGIGGGFIPAVAILFAATSAAFGRRAFFLDLAIGLVLGVVIYLLFDKLLTLSLPTGPIERLI